MTSQIKIGGDLDANTAGAMRGEMERQSAVAGDLEIDMTHVRFIDASGAGAAVLPLRRARARGCKIAVTGLGGQPLGLLLRLSLAGLAAARPQKAVK